MSINFGPGFHALRQCCGPRKSGRSMSYSLLSRRTVRRYHLAMAASMPLSANSGCNFFLTRRKGSANSACRSFRRRRAAVCVITTPDRTPMWGVLADVLGRCFPDQRDMLGLSFSLSDPERLEHMFGAAGFQDVQVERTTRSGVVASFGDYWTSIEAGSGMMPQAYRALSLEDRRLVRRRSKHAWRFYCRNAALR